MTISDGYGFRCVRDCRGFTWVPRQLGRYHPAFGVCAFCHHPNAMWEQQVAGLLCDMTRFKGNSRREMFGSLVGNARPANSADRVTETALLGITRCRNLVGGLIKPDRRSVTIIGGPWPPTALAWR